MADVFISYSKKDRELAERVDRALKSAGYTTWWDDNLIPAEQWNQTIVSEIAAASAVLVIWTFNSIASDFVRDEAETGRKAKKLVPVRFEDVEPPLGQGAIHIADLRGWQGSADDQRWRQVLTAIQNVIDGAGMTQAAGFGSAFERRLMSARPFPRKHVATPTTDDRWQLEYEFSAKWTRGNIAFAVYNDCWPSLNWDDFPPRHVAFAISHSDGTHIEVVGRDNFAHSTKFQADSYPQIISEDIHEQIVLDSMAIRAIKTWLSGISGTISRVVESVGLQGGWQLDLSDYKLFHDFSTGAPIVLMPRTQVGMVWVLDDIGWYHQLPDAWKTAEAAGLHVEWNDDHSACLLTGAGQPETDQRRRCGPAFMLKRNKNLVDLPDGVAQGFIRRVFSWSMVRLECDEDAALQFHPCGLIVKMRAVDWDLVLEFFEPHSNEIIHSTTFRGLGHGGEYRVPNVEVSFSRCMPVVAISVLRAKKVIIASCADGSIIRELTDHSLARYAPDGQRLLTMRGGREAVVYSADGIAPVAIGKAIRITYPDPAHPTLWCPTAKRIYTSSSRNSRGEQRPTVSSFVLAGA